jgi:hypothetical protein
MPLLLLSLLVLLLPLLLLLPPPQVHSVGDWWEADPQSQLFQMAERAVHQWHSLHCTRSSALTLLLLLLL